MWAASSSNEEELSACSEVEVLESRRVDVEPSQDKAAAESFESQAGLEGDPGAEGSFLPLLVLQLSSLQ